MKEYLFTLNPCNNWGEWFSDFFKDYLRANIYKLERYEEKRIEFPLKMVSIIVDAPDGIIETINKFYENLLIYKNFRYKYNFTGSLEDYEKKYMNNIYESLRKMKESSNLYRWNTWELFQKGLVVDTSKVKCILRQVSVNRDKLPLIVIPGLKIFSEG